MNPQRLLPKSLKRQLQSLATQGVSFANQLRASTQPNYIGNAGPLVRNLFEPIRDVPGWFNLDDCGHFSLILAMQSAQGLRGDLLEIGSYHGRSTAVMASLLKNGERVHVCDAFEADAEDHYENKPSAENLMRNLRRVTPNLTDEQVVIHQCLSNDLKVEESQKFRFIHVDGGHSAEQAYFDLCLSRKHLLPHGVIAMDDYHNPSWPGVAEGTDRFLAEHSQIKVIADLNRHGALGRKLYLINSD